MKRTSIFAASLICSMMLSAQTKEDAVLFSGVNLDDSYLLADGVSVVFDNSGNAAIYTGTRKVSEFDIINEVTAEFKDAFKLTANQDPDRPANYYSTFYTSEGAYKVPADGSATAYAGIVKTGEETDVLKLTDVGNIIHVKEPVILKASQSDITLMPSCNTQKASTENILIGIDEEATLKNGDYALTLGQYGVGFYKWTNKPLGANKAYMTLNGMESNAFTFLFDEGTTTGINSVNENEDENENIYNLNGVRVGNDYKGIIGKGGKKYFNR